MAIATGAIVANLYYAQPLLHQISTSFHAGATATSLIVTCTQVGYAAGLLLVVPLGDLRPRKDLVVAVFAFAVVALVVCAVSPSLWLFELASVAAGLASVGGQVMVPLAADLASPDRRGRVVARLMTGLLLGILLARTVAGAAAEVAGWRSIYWVSAALMVAFAVVLRAVLPDEAPRPHLPYWQLVRSSVRLLVDLPVLRRRAWYGSACFASFSVLWTALAFLLAGAPYHYSNLVIGLFGLAGVGGVLAANAAGRLADATRTRAATVVAALLTTVSWALLAAGRTSLAALVIGIVVLDVGVQGMQITNQAVIYALAPSARSRINSAYMVCYFAGGAVASVTTGVVLSSAGWFGVCVLGASYGALAIAGAAFESLRPPRAATAGGTPAPASAGGTPAPASAAGTAPGSADQSPAGGAATS